VTTSALAHDGPTRPPSAGRVGVLAAVTPIAMFGMWIQLIGWGGTASEIALRVGVVAVVAAVAGWIVGRRLGRSIPGGLGFVVYPIVAWLVFLPVGVAGATLGDLSAGRFSDAIGVVGAAMGYLLYGLVAGIYTFVLLLPFGAGWMATFVILRRIVAR
jgi:hypothetical protein